MVILNSVVYYSSEDEKYICHSYECDQIGVGTTNKEAIDDCASNLEFLLKKADEDKSLCVLRTAPEKIQDKFTEVLLNSKKYHAYETSLSIGKLHTYLVEEAND
jgi:hypothetical protein